MVKLQVSQQIQWLKQETIVLLELINMLKIPLIVGDMI